MWQNNKFPPKYTFEHSNGHSPSRLRSAIFELSYHLLCWAYSFLHRFSTRNLFYCNHLPTFTRCLVWYAWFGLSVPFSIFFGAIILMNAMVLRCLPKCNRMVSGSCWRCFEQRNHQLSCLVDFIAVVRCYAWQQCSSNCHKSICEYQHWIRLLSKRMQLKDTINTEMLSSTAHNPHFSTQSFHFDHIYCWALQHHWTASSVTMESNQCG